MSDEFEVGDVVRLKSGGDSWTINCVGSVRVRVVRIVAGRCERDCLPTECFDLVEPDEGPQPGGGVHNEANCTYAEGSEHYGDTTNAPNTQRIGVTANYRTVEKWDGRNGSLTVPRNGVAEEVVTRGELSYALDTTIRIAPRVDSHTWQEHHIRCHRAMIDRLDRGEDARGAEVSDGD